MISRTTTAYTAGLLGGAALIAMETPALQIAGGIIFGGTALRFICEGIKESRDLSVPQNQIKKMTHALGIIAHANPESVKLMKQAGLAVEVHEYTENGKPKKTVAIDGLQTEQ